MKGWLPRTALLGFLMLLVAVGFVAWEWRSRNMFRDTWDRWFTAEMRTNLRRIAEAEMTYHAAHGTYTDDIEALDFAIFDPDSSVRLLVNSADSTRFLGLATHALISRRCSVTVRRAVGDTVSHLDGPWCTENSRYTAKYDSFRTAMKARAAAERWGERR
jgi:hypothetical protein